MKRTHLAALLALSLTCFAAFGCSFEQPQNGCEHSYGEWSVTKQSTCSEKGTETRVCTVCGGEQTRETELAEHSYGEWSVTKQSTCSEKGTETRVCTVCGDEQTREIDIADHVYENGVCKWCEKEDPSSLTVTEAQWKSAFKFENVTISQYAIVNEQKVLVQRALLDGKNGLIEADGITAPISDYVDDYRKTFDFSEFYAAAEYQDGRYFIAKDDLSEDESFVYENAYLSFKNGVLQNISVTVNEQVPQYDEDLNIIGTTTTQSEYYVEFSCYGTTDATKNPKLSLTKTEWEAAFAKSNYDNVTITFSNVDIQEIICHANGKERITVNFSSDGDYYVGTYSIENGKCTLTEVFVNGEGGDVEQSVDLFGETPYLTFTGLIEGELFAVLKQCYYYFDYDEQSNCYVWSATDEIARHFTSYELKIENEKITYLKSVDAEIGESGLNVTQTQIFSFSNFGTTTIS